MSKTKIIIIIIALIFPCITFANDLSVPTATTFTYPLQKWEFSVPEQGFGVKRAKGVYHFGDDVAAPANSSVHSIAYGQVKHVGMHIGFGTVVLIEHTLPNFSKIVSLYGHLGKNVIVKTGQFVNKNQVIGYIGNPEENGGWLSHLHFGIRKGPYVALKKKWVYWGLGPKAALTKWHNPTKFLEKKILYQNFDLGKIITAPNSPGRSHIRMFKKNGRAIRSFGFFAFKQKNRNGCQITTGDINNDQQNEIIASSNKNRSIVKVFEKNTRNLIAELYPFSKKYKGKINLATADFNFDGQDEIIAATGPKQTPLIKIYTLNNGIMQQLGSDLYPFSMKKKTGINIATADTDQNGQKEIFATPASGKKSVLKYWNKTEWITLKSKIFKKTTAKLAIGDIDGDLQQEIIAASQKKMRPTIKIINLNTKTRKKRINPFLHRYKKGINIATADLNNDGTDEIITSKNHGQPRIKIYKYSKKYPIASFLAYKKYFKGGVNIVGLE